MLILINHLTRMRQGFMCTAGIDLATGRHVRPMLRQQMGIELLVRHGGPFEMGHLVDLGPTLWEGQAPEMEDYRFNAKRAVRKGPTSAKVLWDWLVRLSRSRLADLFGPELTPRGPHSCGVDLKHGRVSLGCLSSPRCSDLYLRPRADAPPQVRLRVTDGQFDLDLGVTDIRLYGPDHVTPDEAVVRRVGERLRAKEELILCVGLTRPHAADPNQTPIHWLQANNFHFRDETIWQLG
jgi:hypothetical protein